MFDIQAIKICKLFELDFQNLLVLLQLIRKDVFIKNVHSLVDN
jgi:hypothetical protein